MEALIGFTVGYWVGTRQGRRGLEEAIDAARGIWESPEAKNLLRDGLSALRAASPASELLRKGGRDTPGAIIRSVITEVVERRTEHRAA